ncbi:MAG: AMP-binding protein [Magnetococcales bacterium]|nr:AMP-binding protein [Magnetococcales bacterium]
MSNNQTIPGIVAEWAACDPGRPFLHLVREEGSETLSLADLFGRASAFARLLLDRGLPKGGKVFLFLSTGSGQYAAFLGTMIAGGIPAFMPPLTARQEPELYWESHRRLSSLNRPTALVVDREFAPSLAANLPDQLDRILPLPTLEPAPPLPPGTTSADDIALLQHTSGTTGLKKGVALSHQAIIGQVKAYARLLSLGPSDRIVSWLPLYHDMGLIACFLLPLITATPVTALDPFEWVIRPESLFRQIEADHGTLVWLPNFAFQHLTNTVDPESTNTSLASVRALINCSEPCKAETFERFHQRFQNLGIRPEQLQVCYAMAETVFAVTQTPLGQPVTPLWVAREPLFASGRIVVSPPDQAAAIPLLPVGKALEGLCYRVTQGNSTLPDDQIGEVAIAGRYLFSGYEQRPEETASRLVNDWYYSRDLGFTHGGELYLTGRKDDLLIVHGKNLFAHEVEAVVDRVAGVKKGRCVALAPFDAASGSQQLVIIAETSDKDPAHIRTIRREILNNIQAIFGIRPKTIRLTAEGWLVKTTSGKIHRQENLRKFAAETTPPEQHP